MTAAPLISVVIPTRNEQDNVVGIATAVIAEMEKAGVSFEVIFIDNASQDRTVSLVREICAADPRVKLIVNARNFGQMRSPTHGIFEASGEAVINMCADFQDPPHLLGQFIDRWRAGIEIVLGVRQTEKSSLALGLMRRLAYWFARTFGDFPIIPNATGFGIYDGKVVRAISRLNEPEPFFRGMLVETGYTIETIPYPRPPRAGGRTNNNFLALLDFALSGLAGSSKRLVRVPFFIGAGMMALSAIGLLAFLLSALLGAGAAGWGWFALIQADFGLLFLFLGLIGDQVRLITERTRNTPLVVERERVNF